MADSFSDARPGWRRSPPKGPATMVTPSFRVAHGRVKGCVNVGLAMAGELLTAITPRHRQEIPPPGFVPGASGVPLGITELAQEDRLANGRQIADPPARRTPPRPTGGFHRRQPTLGRLRLRDQNLNGHVPCSTPGRPARECAPDSRGMGG